MMDASAEDVLRKAARVFRDRGFGEPSVATFAPGRVNLIGEHTDYNGGFVLPMALPHGTVVLGRKSDRGECRLITCVVASDISGEANEVVFPVPAHPPSEPRRVAVDGPNWAKYVRGVVALMNEKGDVPAFNAVIASSVPLGGGLSSSAALEVATCLFVRQLCRAPGVDEEENEEEKKRLALVCQEAEHRYAGMPCGIMDQFVSMLAREGHALLIDCQSQATTHIPFSPDNLVVLIANTQYKHQLVEGEYSRRRAGCEGGARKLGKPLLREVSRDFLEDNKLSLEEEEFRYARHVVTEIRRTDDAVRALRCRDYQQFGQLMNASHDSLRDDYRVCCPELNHLVDLALSNGAAVLGSRMTGGGFGGCTVSLVRREALEWTKTKIQERYWSREGKKPLFYEARPSGGARVVPQEQLLMALRDL